MDALPQPVCLDSHFYRCSNPHFPPLSTGGSQKIGGRFNPPGLPTLYLASSPEVALRESTRSHALTALPVFAPRILVCVRVHLSSAIDLLNPKCCEALGLEAQDFTDDWRPGPTRTQVLGRALADAGIEAVLFPSRLDARIANVAVFTANLARGSSLEIIEADQVRE